MRPTVRYATAPDGVRIAYTTYGGAGGATPLLVLRPPQWSHLEREWDLPPSHHEFEAHIASRLVIRMDPRGTGLSQRDVADHSLAHQIADIRAVLDSLGLDRVAIDCISASALAGMAFAARAPDRVTRLVVQNGFASGREWWGVPARHSLIAMAQVDWAAATESWAWLAFGSTEAEQVRALAEHTRACLSQPDFLRMVACEQQIDLRQELPRISAETLVISHPSFARLAPQDMARELVHLIPGARLVAVANRKERVGAITTFLLEGDGEAPADPPVVRVALSEREVEVLTLLARGLTNRGIAERITLSPRTVDSHVANIYAKLGVARRAEAVAYAIRHGFV